MTVETALAPKIRTNLSEYQAIDPKLRYELVQGDLVKMSPTSEVHGFVGGDLFLTLSSYVKTCKLGKCASSETGFIININPDSVLAPDWAFISSNRVPEKLSEKFSRVVPDAVLEVRSPSDRPVEVRKKMELWVEAGVRLAWEYNPRTKLMTVYRPDKEPQEIGLDEIVSGEDVIPGFSMTLREMLA